ncbi:MAG: hydrogenase maturation protease [Isosphaeraceae bacterium]
MIATTRPVILVIGYGNPLRRDDGVGVVAAEEIERWLDPSVRVLARVQLTPDLAADLAEADSAFFIDARSSLEPPEVRIERIVPQAHGMAAMDHAVSPETLLGLCRALYEKTPEAYLVSIASEDLGFGEGLSARATRGLAEALAALRDQICRSRAGEPVLPPPCPGLETRPSPGS